MKLAPHRKANKEFFEEGCAPSKQEWCDWIQKGVVVGKVMDGKPYIDLNHFAANDVMNPIETKKVSGLDLLSL